METFKWHKQSEDDILFAFNGWDYHTFACIMKDGKLEKFSGFHDETCDGEIITHVDCITNDKKYDIDDIDIWIEIPESGINN